MKKHIIVALIGCCVVLASVPDGRAEQVEKDMYATVVVNPVFALSLDNASISFGYSEPGKTIELKPDTYYNFVTCNSNKGKTWYLKISLMGDIAGPNPAIPPESFKWKVFRSTGDGTPQEGWQPFSKDPMVAYTSGQSDNTGNDVVVQFQYKLDMPRNATGGYYNVKVLYTMTDIP